MFAMRYDCDMRASISPAIRVASIAMKRLIPLLLNSTCFLRDRFRMFTLLALLFTSAAGAEVTTFTVLPSATDPEIKTFDLPHYVYVNREIVVDHDRALPVDQHKLLLWLPGTGGTGAGAGDFCKLAANQGYHVISLMYPDSIPAALCGYDKDPKAFEKFRMAIIRGGRTKYISIEKAESIESRLTHLLVYLRSQRPRENWSQFLTGKDEIEWESVAVAGQSQGGGHAALLAVKHCVARVICTGAPKDYSKRHNTPAAWYGENSATPKNRYFVFNHLQDPMGCTPEQLLRNFEALKLDTFGNPADPATEEPPYHHTRILLTSYPPVTVTGKNDEKAAAIAHTSVIAGTNAVRWMNAWKYMLTESVQ
jgi:hypothetical protein